jgi:hypothetical protein
MASSVLLGGEIVSHGGTVASTSSHMQHESFDGGDLIPPTCLSCNTIPAAAIMMPQR